MTNKYVKRTDARAAPLPKWANAITFRQSDRRVTKIGGTERVKGVGRGVLQCPKARPPKLGADKT